MCVAHNISAMSPVHVDDEQHDQVLRYTLVLREPAPCEDVMVMNRDNQRVPGSLLHDPRADSFSLSRTSGLEMTRKGVA